MKVSSSIDTKSMAVMLLLTACTSNYDYKASEDQYFLKEQLQQIEKLIPVGDKKDTSVSTAPVRWHLDHMLKTINSIYDSIASSDPAKHETSFNFLRSAVYLTGTIPRGVAQSPQSVRPPNIILDKDILQQLDTARKKVKLITNLHENKFFNHPRFEQLDRNQTLRFIEIHTNHHLKIIDDILDR